MGGLSVMPLFCNAVLCALSSFAIISLGGGVVGEDRAAVLLLCSECHSAVIIL